MLHSGNRNQMVLCSLDRDYYHESHIRVLNCLHYFCIECLRECVAQGVLDCPECRRSALGNVEDLPNMSSFNGQIPIVDHTGRDRDLDIERMAHRVTLLRIKTIEQLRSCVQKMSDIERWTAGVKIGGSSSGLVGSLMFIAGAVLSSTGVGAPIGAPLMTGGAILGSAGGVAAVGGTLVDSIGISRCLKDIQRHFDEDYFRSVQLRVMIGRSVRHKFIADRLKLSSEVAVGMLGMVGRFAQAVAPATSTLVGHAVGGMARAPAMHAVKVAIDPGWARLAARAVDGPARLAAKVAVDGPARHAAKVAVDGAARKAAGGIIRGSARAGLNLAGVFASFVLIPIDIYELHVNFMKLQNRSAVVCQVETLASAMETDLWENLRDDGKTVFPVTACDSNGQPHYLIVSVPRDVINIAAEFLSRRDVIVRDIADRYLVLVDSPGVAVANETYQALHNVWPQDEVDSNAHALRRWR